MNDRYFNEVVPKCEMTAWEALRLVADNFLGNHTGSSYE